MEKGPSSLGMFCKLKKLHFRIEFSTGHKPSIPWAGREQESLYMSAILEIAGLEEIILEGVMWGFQTLAGGVKAGKLQNLKCLALRCLLVMGMENVATIVDSLKQLKYLEIDDAFDIEGGIKDLINALKKKTPRITFTNLPKLVI